MKTKLGNTDRLVRAISVSLRFHVLCSGMLVATFVDMKPYIGQSVQKERNQLSPYVATGQVSFSSLNYCVIWDLLSVNQPLSSSYQSINNHDGHNKNTGLFRMLDKLHNSHYQSQNFTD
jgi:hypothetical protein